MDPSVEPQLEAYVKGVVRAFAKDDRVLGWDIWNEPDNGGNDLVASEAAKGARIEGLLPKVFEWARAENPSQPLTSGVWTGNWSDPAKESRMTKIQLAESDVISFHNYDWPEGFEARIQSLLPLGRPLICTEYMARGNGSTFDNSLPIAKKYHRQGIDFMDLVEEGNLGLMHSIDKFEPSKGYRFSTYASYWIEQSIRRAVEAARSALRPSGVAR